MNDINEISCELARELMEDVCVGSTVRVGDGRTFAEGTVQKWTANFLTLKRADGGTSRIRLDESLHSLDILSDAASSETPPVPAVPPKPAESELPPVRRAGSLISRTMAELPQAVPYTFSADDWISEIRTRSKALENTALKRAVNGVLDSLSHAVRTSLPADKYRSNRQKLLSAWNSCKNEADFEVFYLSLGILAIAFGDYAYALEPLVRVRQFRLAAYAAEAGKYSEDAGLYAVCALLSGEEKDITQYFSDLCIARRDPDVLRTLLKRNRDNPQMCEKIASCSLAMYRKSGGSLTADITPYTSAYEAADRLLAAIPADWRCGRSAVKDWEIFQSYAFPVPAAAEAESADAEHFGRITDWHADGRYGFIREQAGPGYQDYFFHIRQVCTAPDQGLLLRRMLGAGLGEGLDVCFFPGESDQKAGQIAATDIMLTESGVQDAEQRLNGNFRRHTGIVDTYSMLNETGFIRSDARTYRFRLASAADPRLRACLRDGRGAGQKVTFERSAAEQDAIDLRWADPPESLLQRYDGSLSEKERSEWNRLLRREAAARIRLPEQDPFEGFAFVGLKLPEQDPHALQSVPLTWGGADWHSRNSRRSDKAPADVSASAPVPAAPAGHPTVWTAETARNYAEAKKAAEQARGDRLNKNLTQAAAGFEKALELGGFDESVAADYVSLCTELNQDAYFEKAEALLNRCADDFSTREKLLNLKIQLYEKKKDYAALCPLHEEAARTAASAKKQSHHLIRLISVRIGLEQYDRALDVCRRWETLYAQNRYSSELPALKKALPAVNRRKAICLYYTGRSGEARRLAEELIHTNPNDTVALGILNGTLGSTLTDDDAPVLPEAEEEQLVVSGSLFTGFVRDRIEQTDIHASLKTARIRDGKYTGTAAEGRKDIDFLIGQRRTTSKERSEDFFAACKLQLQLEQRGDGSKRDPDFKNRLAGRAMAAWGDYAAARISQKDTPRMAWLFALSVLDPTKDGTEQGWTDSYNRYIKSYFLPIDGQNSLRSYINQQTNTPVRDAANTDIFAERQVNSAILPEFTVGMLQLTDALSQQTEQRGRLLEGLYGKNPDLRISFCSQLEVILGLPVPQETDRTAFDEYVRMAAAVLKRKENELQRCLSDAADLLLTGSASDAEIAALDECLWKPYLTAVDLNRLYAIQDVLRRSLDYYGSREFESRSDCLLDMAKKIEELLQDISEGPTNVSWDIYSPILRQMAWKTAQMQDRLYLDSQPKLTWQEEIQPFRIPGPARRVQIQLTVKNEAFLQTAEALKIERISGPDIERADPPEAEWTVRSGTKTDISLIAYISEEAERSGNFTASILYSCQYREAPQTPVRRPREAELTLVISREDFQPFRNPFSGLEGKVMEDRSMFFGRTELIERIAGAVCPNGVPNYGGAFALYGQTRIGKSTLLYHLKDAIAEKLPGTAVIWDVGNISELLEDTGCRDFLPSFLYRILAYGDLAMCEDEALSEILEEENPEPPLNEILDHPDRAVLLFSGYLRRLDRILRREGRIIVLLIDEFSLLHSEIKAGRLSPQFMQFWKAILQEHCIYAVIAGQDDMPEFMEESQNQNGFNCMMLHELSYLDEQSARDLIRKPIENANGSDNLFREDAVDEIYELTAGSPYLTIVLCSELVEYLNSRGACTITRGIVSDFLRTKVLGPQSFLTRVHFESQIQERGRDDLEGINYQILLSIAQLSAAGGYAEPGHIAVKVQEKWPEPISAEEIQTLLDRLYRRNVLQMEGGRYRIQIGLLEKWLIAKEGG